MAGTDPSCGEEWNSSGDHIFRNDDCRYDCKQYRDRAGFWNSGSGKNVDFFYFEKRLSSGARHHYVDCGGCTCVKYDGRSVVSEIR